MLHLPKTYLVLYSREESLLHVARQGVTLRSRGQILRWQHECIDSPYCGTQSATDRNRILTAWRVPGSQLEHVIAMDGMLREYKGYVDTTKPIYRPRRRVARQNAYAFE